MKKSASILTKITFGLVIAASIAACKQPTTDTKTAAPVAVDNKATTVYINQDSINTQSKYALDMRKRLEDKGKSTQSDIQSKQQAFQRDYQEAQRNAATMTPEQQKATGERLQSKQQYLQQYQQNASSEFQNLQAEETKKLYDKLMDFTKAYAKEKGYKMILTFQTGATTVLYGDASLDVTADFVKKFNETYDKDSKK